MIKLLSDWLLPLLLVVLGVGLLLPFVGQAPVMDLTGEAALAESAREMLEGGTEAWWRVTRGYEPYWRTPPLLLWGQAAAMAILGVGPMGVRLPVVIVAVLLLVALYLTGRRLHGGGFGFMWALLLLATPAYVVLARQGVEALPSTLLILLSLTSLAVAGGHSGRGGDPAQAGLAGLWLGLALLVQGLLPVGLVLSVVIGVWLWNGTRPILARADLAIMGMATLLTSLVWFGYEFAANGPAFALEFLRHQRALIGQAFGGEGVGAPVGPLGWAGLVLGLAWPTVLLGLITLIDYREREPLSYRRWMVVLMWLSLIGGILSGSQTLALTTLLALAYLGALHARLWLEGRRMPSAFLAGSLALGAGVLALAGLVIPWLMAHERPWVARTLAGPDNPLVYSHVFDTPAGLWTGAEGLPALLLLIAALYSWRLKRRRQPLQGATVLCLGMAGALAGLSWTVSRPVAEHAQGPVVRFFTEHPGHHMLTSGVGRSLALFYGRTPATLAVIPDSVLILGATEAPVALAARLDRPAAKGLMGYAPAGAEGPWRFWVRPAGDRPIPLPLPPPIETALEETPAPTIELASADTTQQAGGAMGDTLVRTHPLEAAPPPAPEPAPRVVPAQTPTAAPQPAPTVAPAPSTGPSSTPATAPATAPTTAPATAPTTAPARPAPTRPPRRTVETLEPRAPFAAPTVRQPDDRP